MTRDDMQTIVNYYILSASPKGVREEGLVQCAGGAVQDFLFEMYDYLKMRIEEGEFDE